MNFRVFFWGGGVIFCQPAFGWIFQQGGSESIQGDTETWGTRSSTDRNNQRADYFTCRLRGGFRVEQKGKI